MILGWLKSGRIGLRIANERFCTVILREDKG